MPLQEVRTRITARWSNWHRQLLLRTALCPWTETVLYQFQGGADGAYPTGYLVFDKDGNIYGTTQYGGSASCDCGTVYKLKPSKEGWTKSILYTFQGGSDGARSSYGVILDKYGNLYERRWKKAAPAPVGTKAGVAAQCTS